MAVFVFSHFSPLERIGKRRGEIKQIVSHALAFPETKGGLAQRCSRPKCISDATLRNERPPVEPSRWENSYVRGWHQNKKISHSQCGIRMRKAHVMLTPLRRIIFIRSPTHAKWGRHPVWIIGSTQRETSGLFGRGHAQNISPHSHTLGDGN